MMGDARLSDAATAAMKQAEAIFVSAISLLEIGQKVRSGKWPRLLAS
jgi:PIN domain nuclease of toxin-antitoxin system